MRTRKKMRSASFNQESLSLIDGEFVQDGEDWSVRAVATMPLKKPQPDRGAGFETELIDGSTFKGWGGVFDQVPVGQVGGTFAFRIDLAAVVRPD